MEWPINYLHYVPHSSSFIEMMRGAMRAMDCASVKPGENVVISTDTNKLRLAEALAAAAHAVGAVPTIVMITPPGAHGAQPPAPVVGACAQADVFFLPTTWSQTHTDARIEAIKNGARGATMCEVTEDAMCVGGILADFEECDRVGRKLGALLSQATTMRMTTPAGTDIVGEVTYAALRSGKIKLLGKEVPTASLSSYSRAIEIANTLKDWILKGDFYLTEPVAPLPGADSGLILKPMADRPFEKEG